MFQCYIGLLPRASLRLQMVMERDLQLQERQMIAARERESEEAFDAMLTSNRAKARTPGASTTCRCKMAWPLDVPTSS